MMSFYSRRASSSTQMRLRTYLLEIQIQIDKTALVSHFEAVKRCSVRLSVCCRRTRSPVVLEKRPNYYIVGTGGNYATAAAAVTASYIVARESETD